MIRSESQVLDFTMELGPSALRPCHCSGPGTALPMRPQVTANYKAAGNFQGAYDENVEAECSGDVPGGWGDNLGGTVCCKDCT